MAGRNRAASARTRPERRTLMHESQLTRTVSMRVTSGLHWSWLRRRPNHDHSFELKSRFRAAFPWKASRRKYFREKGMFSRCQGSPYQASLDARLLIPLPVRRRASTVRPPIRARGASDTTRGHDEDSFSISRSCSVVISICRTIAADGRALPTAFAVQ
jgi:hypothetical protein